MKSQNYLEINRVRTIFLLRKIRYVIYLNKIVKHALHLFCVKLVLAILAEFHERRKGSINTLVSAGIEHLV